MFKTKIIQTKSDLWISLSSSIILCDRKVQDGHVGKKNPAVILFYVNNDNKFFRY